MTRAQLESLARQAANVVHRFAPNARLSDAELAQFGKLYDWFARHPSLQIKPINRPSDQICKHLETVFGEPVFHNTLGLALIANGFKVWHVGGMRFDTNVSAAIFNIWEE